MDKILIPLKALAGEATIPQLKYWAKLLGVLLITHGRVAHVEEKDAALLREVGRLVKGGKSPQEAVSALGIIIPDDRMIARREGPNPGSGGGDFEELKDALMTVVGELKAVKDENAAFRVELATAFQREMGELRNQVQKLTAENQALRVAMLPAPAPAKQVIPWQPQRAEDPRKGLGFFQRLWVEIAQPELLRRNLS